MQILEFICETKETFNFNSISVSYRQPWTSVKQHLKWKGNGESLSVWDECVEVGLQCVCVCV